ncbi:ParA family protein [Natronincola ferrireducens]|uniref:Chromosome partitioning protein n=1 Tax=Natronincola ferrireducens TaxID=393762 RepID=A0A1G9H8V2_9FIRM|nr:ParA family protein [Natronincola ferrireducens]SDL09275.1 chromosome partitioning protein [Natronincola ferrireducens]
MKKNVISFMNMKGGVGKSTLCVNIAHCLSMHFNKKVLLIDIDPQFNATQYLLPQHKYIEDVYGQNQTIHKIFQERNLKPSLVDGVVETDIQELSGLEYDINDNLSLIPGDLRMVNVEKSSATGREHKLTKYIEKNGSKENFDFIFIDCPPTQSIYTLAAFYASNFYLMPVKPDFLSVLGISLFQNAIKEYNEELPHKIKCLGMIFTLAQERTNHGSAKMNEIREKYKLYTFDNYMKHSIKVPEHAENNTCLYDMGEDFRKNIVDLTTEFLNAYNNEVGGSKQ